MVYSTNMQTMKLYQKIYSTTFFVSYQFHPLQSGRNKQIMVSMNLLTFLCLFSLSQQPFILPSKHLWSVVPMSENHRRIQGTVSSFF